MAHRLTVAALAAGLALALAAPAGASPSADVGLSDDRALLLADGPSAHAAAARWAALGVDVVRLHARWSLIAPAPRARRPPRGFRGDDPAAPGYDWRRLDQGVGAARAAGLRVVLTVTGPGPVWSSQAPARRDGRYKPSPARFGAFAAAVARRYAPEVDRYIVWNEPNLKPWLNPQSACRRRRCTPYAPHHYRRLVRAAEPAIRRADPGAEVAIGALAPRGTAGRTAGANLRPLVFLRALACVDRRYRRVRTGPCRGFRAPGAALYAHHPHGIDLPPARRSPHRDEVRLADLGRLNTVLDRLVRRRRLVVRGAGRFPLLLDEYGYQTRPPDRFLGVSLAKQSAYLQEAAHRAWRHPRVRGLIFYGWRDDPLRPRGAGWQSGLLFAGGRPKPALQAFADPFWAQRTGRRTLRLWGQVRPGAATRVTLERRVARGRWAALAQVPTDGRGGFSRTVRIDRPTSFRFRWSGGVSDARTARPR